MATSMVAGNAGNNTPNGRMSPIVPSVASSGTDVGNIAAMPGNMQTRHIGARLRHAREAAGLTATQVGKVLGISRSAVSRYETGQRGISDDVLADYLEAVGADQATVDELARTTWQAEDAVWVTFARGADRRTYMAALMEAEDSANKITQVALGFIPGLLQTTDTIRTLIRTAGTDEADVPGRLTERLGRRALFEERPGLQMEVYLDEAVLRRHVGGAAVLREQLGFLLERSEADNVSLSVVPFSAERHPQAEGQFTLIESASDDPVVYQETRGVVLFYNQQADIDSYRQVVGTCKENAMSPRQSRELIARIMKEIDPDDGIARGAADERSEVVVQ